MRNLQSASRVIVPTEVCAAINICIDSDRRGLWIATRYKRLHFVNTDTGKVSCHSNLSLYWSMVYSVMSVLIWLMVVT